MNITINTSDLLASVRDTFLTEATSLPEEAGSARPSGLVTEAETERAFHTAMAAMRTALGRFIMDCGGYSATYGGSIPSSIVIALNTTGRTPASAEQLATMLHNSLAEAILSALFKPLSDEKAEAHAVTSADTLSATEQVLLSKKPSMPRL